MLLPQAHDGVPVPCVEECEIACRGSFFVHGHSLRSCFLQDHSGETLPHHGKTVGRFGPDNQYGKEIDTHRVVLQSRLAGDKVS